MNPPLSPRQLAQALGVSESSVKRWVDGGRIDARRTPGGHRRIPVPEAIRFVRQSQHSLAEPQLLGLSEVGEVSPGVLGADEEAAELAQALEAGAAARARGLLLSLYLDGRGAAALIDGPIRCAMRRLGEHWRRGEEGIFIEHRATDIVLQALNQLRTVLPPVRDGAPAAVGAAPAGDPYLLPTLGAATVLQAAGFQVTNLGPDTPTEALLAAARQLGAQLVWLSVSAAGTNAERRREVRRLLAGLEPLGATLVAGGSRVGELALQAGPNVFAGSSMGELAAFARGLAAAQRPA
jgi:excisionase family DNA binding protein